MFCTACGTQIPDNAKFCSNCGATRPVAVEPSSAPHSQSVASKSENSSPPIQAAIAEPAQSAAAVGKKTAGFLMLIGSILKNNAGFVVLYIGFMIPTYVLPYFGSNSAVLATVSAAAGLGLMPQWWAHVIVLHILFVIAWIRGGVIGKSWLCVLPFIAAVFDMMPGINLIPLIPTVMHLLAVVLGVKEKPVDSATLAADDRGRFEKQGRTRMIVSLGSLAVVMVLGVFSSIAWLNASKGTRPSSLASQPPRATSSTESSGTPPVQVTISNLGINQSIRGISFQKGQPITYFGQQLFAAGTFDENDSELRISSPTPRRSLVYVVLVDRSKGGWDGAIVSERERDIVVRELGRVTQDSTGKRRVLLGDKIFWHPNERYAMVEPFGEVLQHAVIIDAESKRADLVAIGKYEQSDCEWQHLDFAKTRWETESIIRFAMTFDKNPYEAKCDSQTINRQPIPVRIDVLRRVLVQQ